MVKHQFAVMKRVWPETTKLRDITRTRVQSWIEKRMKTVSANTIGHHMRALRARVRVMNLPSPTADSRLIVPDAVPAKSKAMSWAAVNKKLDEIKADDLVAWGIIGMVAYTGVRRTEMARMAVEDVDLDGAVLHVRHAKVAKQPRSLPMPQGLSRAIWKSHRVVSRPGTSPATSKRSL